MRFSLKSYGALLALILFLASPAGAQQAETRRGVTPEDYYAFEFLRDPRISPDGKLVAYVVQTIDRKQNRRNSSIWLATTDGSRPPWQFTTSPQSSTSPQWSPDGQSLAFLSSRPTTTDGAAQSEGASAASNRPKNQIY